MGNLLPVSQVKTDSSIQIPSYLECWMNWRRYLSRDGGPVFGVLTEIMEGETINRAAFVKKMAARMKKKNSTCPICDGRGTVDMVDYGSNINWCFCEMIDWFIRVRSENSTWECAWSPKSLLDFKIEKQRPNFKKLEYMKIVTQRFAENPCIQWMLISGGTGAGKSHMTEYIRTELGDICLYIACQNISSMVHGSLSDSNYQELLNAMRNTPILLLDDWGAQYNSPFVKSVLADVVDYRYRNPRIFPTVVTTNLSDTAMREFDGRSASRLLDTGNSWEIDVDGVKDYRSNR